MSFFAKKPKHSQPLNMSDISFCITCLFRLLDSQKNPPVSN